MKTTVSWIVASSVIVVTFWTPFVVTSMRVAASTPGKANVYGRVQDTIDRALHNDRVTYVMALRLLDDLRDDMFSIALSRLMPDAEGRVTADSVDRKANRMTTRTHHFYNRAITIRSQEVIRKPH